MARFTNGSAHYLRRVNTGNYEHKEAAADISWAVADEDSDAVARDMMELAANEARRVVREQLGLTKKTVNSEAAPAPVEPPKLEPVEPPKLEPVEPPKLEPARPGRPRKVNPALQQIIADGEAAKARLQSTATDPLLTATDPLLAAEITDADPLLTATDPLLDLSAAPAEITDAELHSAMVKSVQRLDDALSVRKVLGKYAPQYSMVPQERRAAFLAEIEAL